MPKRKLIFQKGQIFYDWTVLEEIGTDKWRRRLYLVKCKCGTISKVAQYALKKGKSKSCHPCSSEKAKQIREAFKKYIQEHPIIEKTQESKSLLDTWKH